MNLEKVIQDIKSLKKERDSLNELCGQIIATLHINRERGTLIALSPEGSQCNEELDRFIASWDRWYKNAKGPTAPLRCLDAGTGIPVSAVKGGHP